MRTRTSFYREYFLYQRQMERCDEVLGQNKSRLVDRDSQTESWFVYSWTKSGMACQFPLLLYLLILTWKWCRFQWIPPPTPDKQRDADEQISIDLGDEYEAALTDASQEEIIDLAGKLHYGCSLATLVHYGINLSVDPYRLRQFWF